MKLDTSLPLPIATQSTPASQGLLGRYDYTIMTGPWSMNYCEDCKSSFKMFFYHDCRESDLLVTTNHMVETDKLQSEVRTTLYI